MKETILEKNSPSKRVVLKNLDTMLAPPGLRIEALLETLPAEVMDKWRQERKIKGLYGIVNAICYGQESRKLPRTYYVNIHNRDLRVIVGREKDCECLYKVALEILSGLGVIEINNHYERGKFSRSYRLCAPWRAYKALESVSFRKRKVRADKVSKADSSEITDSVTQYIFNCIQGLEVDETDLAAILGRWDLPEVRRKRIQDGADKIKAGIANVKRGGKVNRIYHTVTAAPRELRQTLRLKGGERLAEVDVKACHPALVLSLAADVPADELAKYKEALAGDIYAISASPRAKAKKECARFLNGKYQFKNNFGEAFTAMFPTVAKNIRNFKGSVGQYLQNLESKICIYGIVDSLRAAGIFCVSIHDAFLVPASRAGEVAEIVEDILRREIGFSVRVEVKERKK